MNKRYHLIFLLLGIIFVFKNPSTFALQSGGAEIGDLKKGSVIWVLEADFTLTALCVGGQKAWYPPIIVLDLRSQGTGWSAGQPVLIEVKNSLPIPQGLKISANSPFVGPTSLTVQMKINPGETKYIGIPTSDLTFVRTGSLFTYKSSMDSNMQGGQIYIIK
jgi:hypothetical protein